MLAIEKEVASFFKVTKIDSPNGGHVLALKRSLMGPNEVTLKNLVDYGN